MNRTKVLTQTIIFCLFFLSACTFNGKKIDGNGKFISEKRSAENISKISLEGAINVVLENGLSTARVEADENLIPFIVTETNGQWLKVRIKDDCDLRSSKPVTVYVSTLAITQIEVKGSGNVNANGKFSSTDKMSFNLSGSGSITMDLNAPDINADIAGSGTVHVSGQTRTIKVSIAGSGDFDGANLKAENAVVDIAGSGDAVVFADVSVKASIAGSGNVKYQGSAVVDKHVSGSGEVIKSQQ